MPTRCLYSHAHFTPRLDSHHLMDDISTEVVRILNREVRDLQTRLEATEQVCRTPLSLASSCSVTLSHAFRREMSIVNDSMIKLPSRLK